ncbi:MAG: c-type cytochrome [Gammaproteobacteria bacterium]
MSLPNRFVTAALTIAFSLLTACDSAPRTHTTAGNHAAAPPLDADMDVDAQTAGQPAETQQASAGSGELKFNNFCRTCHSLREGDNRLGPSLHGIIGRKAGSSPGYASYSQAMAESGIVWDEATLDRFLANPDAVMPGNNMKPFSRIPEPAVRKEIIEHLKTAGEG